MAKIASGTFLVPQESATLEFGEFVTLEPQFWRIELKFSWQDWQRTNKKNTLSVGWVPTDFMEFTVFSTSDITRYARAFD